MSFTNLKNKIGKSIKKLVSRMDFKDWVIVILFLTALILGISSRHYYNKTLYPDIVYMTDSLDVYKNKLNEEYMAKNTYIQTIKQLKESNAELYQEVKNLKDKPIVVTKTKIETRIDTIVAYSDSITSPSVDEKSLFWHIRETDGYYTMNGKTDVKTDFSSFTTTLNNLSIPADLTVNVIEQNKQLRIIAKSSNPYIHINNINGSVIDPQNSDAIKSCFKQKRWSLGPQVGISVDKNLNIGPTFGIGISYSLISF